jgi:hypothetical protein
MVHYASALTPQPAGRIGQVPRNPGCKQSSLQRTDSTGCKLDRKLSLQGTEIAIATEVCTQVCSDIRSETDKPTVPYTPVAPKRKLEACTQDGGLDGQVCSASDRPWYPPAPTNGRDQIAITIPINGSEEMELLRWSADKGVSMPAYVITKCGYDQWRLEAVRSRPVRPSGRRPVRHALERRSVTIVVSREILEDLWRRSQDTGLRLAQFIRTLLGFDVRRYSNPRTHERDHEMEDAKERLERLGLDWKVYLPDY